jgi:NAD(P)-dependent dehydrogenase (short-subunit alcohol dehydrogenase family)
MKMKMSKIFSHGPSGRKAYIITGPTSGIGRATALELAKLGTVVLVGRDRKKLDEVQKVIAKKGQYAVPVVCDLSDIASVRNAAKEITELDLPIAGLINNAGIYELYATKNALGWDMTFATNHLGPFALTEALIPPSCRLRECGLRLLRRGRPRAESRGGGRLSRRPLSLCGGKRAR